MTTRPWEIDEFGRFGIRGTGTRIQAVRTEQQSAIHSLSKCREKNPVV
jgi:hypothetical protein